MFTRASPSVPSEDASRKSDPLSLVQKPTSEQGVAMTDKPQAAVQIGAVTSPSNQGLASPRLARHYRAACLLLLIGTKPAHGYELRERLSEFVGASQDMGQMYRTLRSLEEDRLVVSCWQDSETGPARRTYHISEQGSQRLQKLVEEISAGHRLTGAFLDRYNSTVPSLEALA